MKLEHVLPVAALMLTAACSAPAEKSSTSASALDEEAPRADGEIATEGPGDDSPVWTIDVDDLDGDGQKEVWYTRASLCGTGGCTYSIHLSTRPGETFGDAFGKQFYPRGPRGSAAKLGDPASFQAENRGGACYYALERYYWNGATYEKHDDATTDCNEVINRAADAPIADGEYRCLALVPRDPCRTRQDDAQ